jgi:vitamin B12 transporter
MRGTNSSHVLVLIDGIKVGSAGTGLTQFEFLPLDQIERVEIIRGPQSSLYGSEAIGGVIQIFTRKGTSNQPKISLETGGGSYNTAKVAGSVSGKVDNSWYSLSAAHLTSDGFNGRQNYYGYYEPDKDGYENSSGTARFGHRFANNSEIEAFFMRAEGINQYDSAPDWQTGVISNSNRFIEQVVGISGKFNITDNWQTNLRLGQSRDDNNALTSTGASYNNIENTRWNASWLNQFTLSDNQQLIIGSDYRLDEVHGDKQNVYSKSSRYDFGGFAQLHSKVFEKHFINASLRGDGNEAFGNYVTGNIGWRYQGILGLSPFASFGNAFKAPTFNDLYRPDWGGNPNLKPEESQSVEAGVAGDYSWGRFEVRAYHTDIDNLIAWVGNSIPPNYGILKNVNKARIDGLETEISTQIYGFNTKLNLNLLNPHDVTNNSRLIRRADKMLSFDISKSINQFDLGATVIAQGERFDYPANYSDPATVTLAGFVTADIRASYHLNKNWILNAKLSNLFDQNYQTVNAYNSAGRNFFITVQYNQ